MLTIDVKNWWDRKYSKVYKIELGWAHFRQSLISGKGCERVSDCGKTGDPQNNDNQRTQLKKGVKTPRSYLASLCNQTLLTDGELGRQIGLNLSPLIPISTTKKIIQNYSLSLNGSIFNYFNHYLQYSWWPLGLFLCYFSKILYKMHTAYALVCTTNHTVVNHYWDKTLRFHFCIHRSYMFSSVNPVKKRRRGGGTFLPLRQHADTVGLSHSGSSDSQRKSYVIQECWNQCCSRTRNYHFKN